MQNNRLDVKNLDGRRQDLLEKIGWMEGTQGRISENGRLEDEGKHYCWGGV